MAIGVLAATAAAVTHEAIGHGLGCLIVGGRVALLTSIFFRCSGGTPLTDVAGPLASLFVGLLLAAGLNLAPRRSWTRLLLLIGAGLNLCWFAGQLVYSAALNGDDWAFVARGLRWPPLWRAAAIAVGVAAYLATTRYLARRAAPVRPRTLLIAYLAGAASAVVAGMIWSRAPVKGAWEGAMTLGLAPLGFLSAAMREAKAVSVALSRSWAWIAVAAVAYLAFALLQARGIGPLA